MIERCALHMEIRMTWHAVHLTNDEVLSGRERALMDSLDRLLTTAQYPRGAAVFSRYNMEDSSTDILISPAAMPICGAVVQAFGAVPCEQLQKDKGVGLLLGDQRDLDALLKNQS